MLQDWVMGRSWLTALAATLVAGTATANTFWGFATSGPEGPPPYVAPSEEIELPRPPVVQTAVDFWTRVYTDADTGSGYLHDARHLDIVYELIELPEGASRKTRARVVNATKQRYAQILGVLAKGRRTGLSAEEARVLALWEGREDELDGAVGRLRFQLGQSDRFRAGLVRSGRWTPYIRSRFQNAGLPVQLTALPHVESSFDPGARSHVGAAGMWQFTRSTGRRYMRIDHVVDERLDPFLATDAAIQLLTHDYQVTGSWPLAITAYNHGAAGMRNAADSLGTDDIGVIIEQYRGRTFGFASRNFYPAFLAAVDVSTEPERYFGPVQPDPAADQEVLETDAYYPVASLAQALGVDRSTLRTLNPALSESVWIGDKYVPKGFPVRSPRGTTGAPDLQFQLAAVERFDTQRPDEFHRVERGEALSVIASQYGVSVRQLMAANGLSNPNRIRAGTVLRLPIPARQPHVQHAVLTDPSSGRTVAVRSPAAETLALNAPAPKFVIPKAEVVAAETVAEAPEAEVLSEAPVAEVAATETEVAASADEAEVVLDLPPMDLSADPSNYDVAADGTIEILPVETLGHYAEWLGVRASTLRSLNRIAYGSPVVVGHRLRLDFSRVDHDTFEARRRVFHRELQETFFARQHITGTTRHVVRPGDSLWELSEVRYRVPVWLLRQYNPDLDLSRIHPGNALVIPVIGPNDAAAPAREAAGQAM